jgi:hypothetical protein
MEIPLDDLITSADAIVRGTVVRSRTRLLMSEQSLEPHTLTTVRVSAWLKGRGDSSIVIEELGGTWTLGGLRIDGVPIYRVGEEVLVFLDRSPDDPRHYRTHQMVQGKFSVRRGVGGFPDIAWRDFSAIAIADFNQGAMSVAPRTDGAMLLRVLSQRISELGAAP